MILNCSGTLSLQASLLTANAEPNVTILPIIVTNPTRVQLTSGSFKTGKFAMLRKYVPKVIKNIPTTISPITLNICGQNFAMGP
jgi:hypothetical protein